MNKPVGYYTNYTPGNGSILEVLETKYGCYLQKLNKREKMALIRGLSLQLCLDFSDDNYNSELNQLIQNLHVLPESDRVGLIRCLADNLEV